MLSATVDMPGSCGELAQGTLEGISFHITCPVDIYSRVTVELNADSGCVQFPEGRTKSFQALKQVLANLKKEGMGGYLRIISPLPMGKGMASSTADVAGTIEAVCGAFGEETGPEEVARIALTVEPSDGVFFPGIVAFDHREGRLNIPLGMPPPMDIIVLDCGGTVDTLAFNKRELKDILKRQEPIVKEAFKAIEEGLLKGDSALIGEGATLSATANQEINFKPQLEEAMSLARDVGAVGVNTGHSGTVIGILLDARKSDREAAAGYISGKSAGMKWLFNCA
ncbi:MAG: GHMP kinase, partial [Dehalococcoidia bacterium]|nr:GHMP kinase [Dehalococcoidia bacterium]